MYIGTSSELNGFINGAALNNYASSAYFDNTQFNDDYSNNLSSPTSSVSDAYHIVSGLVSFASPGAYSSVATSAADAPGRLRSSTFAEAAGDSSQAFATGTSILADTVTLSSPATIHIAGLLDGYLAASGFASAQVSLKLYFVSPFSSGEEGQHDSYGGYEFDDTVNGDLSDGGTSPLYPGSPSIAQPFSFDVDLPAGDTFVYTELSTTSNAETITQGGILYGGSSNSDFSHTLNFSLSVPDGITLTTSSGLLAIPEPATLSLVTLLFPFLSRRRRPIA
jgi:hypothetical protein